eukprot:jgi/Ulvmu1/9971/UM059_0020.1
MSALAALKVTEPRRNHRIHLLYARRDYDKCLDLIQDTVTDAGGGFAHYPIFIRAIILRQQGLIKESLRVLEEAIRLDPQNPDNLKQVGHSLYLLGQHKVALDVFDEALNVYPKDWEIYHERGLCYLYLSQLPQAEVALRRAIELEPYEKTYEQLGKVLVMQERPHDALVEYKQCLKLTPDNADVLCQIGLLYLRQGDNELALDALRQANAINPQHAKATLALGSVLQDSLDLDGALLKYRVAAAVQPNIPQVWNNVGLCFLGKQRYIAAIACLKRAQYLGPFEWIVCYNLGLVHLNTAQHAAAFNYFSAAINLRPTFAHTYMYLGVTLARLGDLDNAFHAYERAIGKDGNDPIFYLNYAVTLFNAGLEAKSREMYEEFQVRFDEWDDDLKDADPDINEQAHALASLLPSLQ